MITETCLSHVWATNIYCYEALNSFGYTSNRCTFDMQYFYCFNSFLLKISTSNKIWRPWFLDFKCTFFNLYMEWQCFTADKISFASYLSIPALISGLHKMPQTLDLTFRFIFRNFNDSLYSLWGLVIFSWIRTPESEFTS